MADPVVHGIPNCDTVKRARAWLSAQGVVHRFHDFKKSGVPADRLDAWIASDDGPRLLNRQGSTWRRLDAAVQDEAQTPAGARELMLAQPSLIKRPVVDWGGGTTVGFDAVRWAALIASGLAKK